MKITWLAVGFIAATAGSVDQSGLLSSAPVTVPDSQQVREDARKAQRQFERTRRRRMRWTYPTYGRCDERIGRYCLSNIDWGDDEDWTPPTEAPEVAFARATLIAHLDSAASTLPGDGWIAGQRVRYLVEAEDNGGALRAARDCAAVERWWCLALAGFAHYGAESYAASEGAYRRALARMDPEVRCQWTDLSNVLEGDLRGQYRDLECAERDSLQRRILWLADPFYSVPGNELAAEHFSRHVHSALLIDAESPEGERWGKDLHRFVVRYGWTFGWERIQSNDRWTNRPVVRGHFGHGAKYFLPKAAYVDAPALVKPDNWDLESFHPRAGHAPPYAKSAFEPLEHQLVAFRHGDSLIVTVAYEVLGDSIPDTALMQAALVMAPDERTPPSVVVDTVRGRVGSLRLSTRLSPQIVSVEVVALSERRAARARYGLHPDSVFGRAAALDPSTPDGTIASPALSGLLLTYADDSLPETLGTAVPAARPNLRVRPGERIGLYWEVYGAGPAARRISTSLTLIKTGKGFFGHVAGLFGIGSDEPHVSLEWEDVVPPGAAFYPRSVAVDLPDNLGNGNYLLTLQAQFGPDTVLRLNKRLVVRDH